MQFHGNNVAVIDVKKLNKEAPGAKVIYDKILLSIAESDDTLSEIINKKGFDLDLCGEEARNLILKYEAFVEKVLDLKLDAFAISEDSEGREILGWLSIPRDP